MISQAMKVKKNLRQRFPDAFGGGDLGAEFVVGKDCPARDSNYAR
jgi:hypothetical protein